MSTRAVAFWALMTIIGFAVYAYAYDADNYVGDLEDSGLTNPMAADLDMDGNNILDCGYWESNDADVADAGAIRLGATDIIGWEDSPAGTDHTLGVDGDSLTWTGGPLKSSQDGGGWLTLLDTTDPGDTNGRAQVAYQALSDTSVTRLMCSSRMEVTDVTNAAEYADLRWNCITNGDAAIEYMRIDSSLGLVDFSSDIAIDATKKIYLDGNGDRDTYFEETAEDRINTYVGGELRQSIRDTNTRFYVGSSGQVTFSPLSTATNSQLELYYQSADSTPTNNDVIYNAQFRGEDSADNVDVYAKVLVTQEEVTSTDEDGSWALQIMNNGTAATAAITCDMSDGVEDCAFGVPVRHNQGTTLPAACVTGQVFYDTDSDDCADTGGGDGCICFCKTTNTWAIVQNI